MLIVSLGFDLVSVFSLACCVVDCLERLVSKITYYVSSVMLSSSHFSLIYFIHVADLLHYC